MGFGKLGHATGPERERPGDTLSEKGANWDFSHDPLSVSGDLTLKKDSSGFVVIVVVI